MSIKELISINANYTRSINLERDVDSFSVVHSYIPTTRALFTLARIVDGFNNKDIPRAFALVGPYGSGKSAFAIFLSHILGSPKDDITIDALEILSKADNSLAEHFFQNLKRGTSGYLNVLITGTPEPLVIRFVVALYESAKQYWQGRRGPTPKVVEKLYLATQEPDLTIKEIIQLVKELQDAVSKSSKGILVVFDELGKFLEYEARHYGANDIYLLQALAEHAYKGHESNLILTVLMHQGFEQYARGLGESLRNEWSKIQGRFESIPFLESTEQTLHVVSRAFQSHLTTSQQNKIDKKCKSIAKILKKQNALPGTISEENSANLFAQCYPLHPTVSLVLPILCQKLAQNERTLFSYLGSKEPYGFKDCLMRLETVGSFINLWEIYEYFILNQPAVLTDPLTHRRWAEVVTALERLGDAPAEEIQVIKSIGVLNLIGAHSGLKASKVIVDLCLPDKNKIKGAIASLIKKSVLQYRKYSGEYRIWQGSDFDLEAAVQDELSQIGRFSLPESLNSRKPLPPIVARRHTIETGSLRYYQTHYTDPPSYIKEQSPDQKQQRIIFCLIETPEDRQIFHDKILGHFSDIDVVVLCPNGDQLREATAEVMALNRVQNNRPELHSDPVATREFKDRLAVAEQVEDELLSAFVDSPENAEWYWKSKKLPVINKRIMQNELSSILDKIYWASPIINNELINRDKPSAQAAAARNKLVSALLHFADKENLGIEKYPAEKGIYLALLKATKLHQKKNDKWQLVPPNKTENSLNIYPAWKRIKKFINSTEGAPKSFAELNQELKEPPYGIKEGVLPILYLASYICYQNELAFYENEIYTPYITDQHIERFIKRPDIFSIQRFRISGIRASLFRQYIQVLYGETPQKRSLLSIARPFAKFMTQLEDFTKKTSRISDSAQKVRKAFELAKSPSELLFDRLPEACGFQSINPDETDEKKIEGFAVALVKIINELRDAYKSMAEDMQRALSQALLPDIEKRLSLSELRKKVCGRYEELIQYTADTRELRPFIEHLSDNECDDSTWFTRLLIFLGKKAPQKWSDNDRDEAVFNLSAFSKRLIDLRFLQSHYLKKQSDFSGDFDIFLLRTIHHGRHDFEEVIKIDASQKKYISATKKKVEQLLMSLKDDESRLAILAKLADNFLVDKREKTGTVQPLKKQKANEKS